LVIFQPTHISFVLLSPVMSLIAPSEQNLSLGVSIFVLSNTNSSNTHLYLDFYSFC